MNEHHPAVDFSSLRPYFNFSASLLVETAQRALLPEVMDIETATLAHDELVHRSKARRIRTIFKDAAVQPIPWLKSARECLKILETPDVGHYQGHLYVILIDGYSETNQYYGVYVGSSRYLPETRFKQHKAGINPSGRVTRRGVQILRSLCWPWQPVPGAKDKRIYWESALNRCLATEIPKVSGDFRLPGDWPLKFQMPLQNLISGNN